MLACPNCGVELGGGIDRCPACERPLVDSPVLTAVTWTTPNTRERFDGRCPWCGQWARSTMRAVTDAYLCQCGSLALGAWAADFDDLVDDAIDLFEVKSHPQWNRSHDPRSWLEPLGIEFRDGGKRGDNYYYWLRNVDGRPPPRYARHPRPPDALDATFLAMARDRAERTRPARFAKPAAAIDSIPELAAEHPELGALCRAWWERRWLGLRRPNNFGGAYEHGLYARGRYRECCVRYEDIVGGVWYEDSLLLSDTHERESASIPHDAAAAIAPFLDDVLVPALALRVLAALACGVRDQRWGEGIDWASYERYEARADASGITLLVFHRGNERPARTFESRDFDLCLLAQILAWYDAARGTSRPAPASVTGRYVPRVLR